MPGWRDFERTVALAFNGVAPENKGIFDVLLPDRQRKGIAYGISCKMRGELRSLNRMGRATIELKNPAGGMWQELNRHGLHQNNYRESPELAGRLIINLYRDWHDIVGIERGGYIDLTKSCYLLLSWDIRTGFYQLHQFPLELPEPETLRWWFQTKISKGVKVPAARLQANDESGKVFEWYGTSGGQLKYYPLAENAVWISRPFELEPLGDLRYGILHKAEAYFPELWAEACKEEVERK